jgi:hypothetical protein
MDNARYKNDNILDNLFVLWSFFVIEDMTLAQIILSTHTLSLQIEDLQLM